MTKPRRDVKNWNSRPHLLSQKQIDWAYKQWCLGYTYDEIAAALFCSNKTILREFKMRGFKKVRPKLIYDFSQEDNV